MAHEFVTDNGLLSWSDGSEINIGYLMEWMKMNFSPFNISHIFLSIENIFFAFSIVHNGMKCVSSYGNNCRHFMKCRKIPFYITMLWWNINCIWCSTMKFPMYEMRQSVNKHIRETPMWVFDVDICISPCIHDACVHERWQSC